VGKRSKEMRGSDGTASVTPPIFLPGLYVQKKMERMSSIYYMRNRADTIKEI
jgi:hypothetical protein